MKRPRVILFSGALTLCAGPGIAQTGQEPLLMTPSSDWVVDYAEDSCALRRAFQAGDERAILQLRQFAPSNSFEVILVSATLSRSDNAPRVRFEPDEDFREPPAALFVDDGETHGIQYTDSLRPNAFQLADSSLLDWPVAERDARERTVSALSVTATFERNLILQTGSMHQPMEAMRACLDELLTHWGLDAAVQRTLSRPVKPIDQTGWSRRVLNGYPVDMLRAGRSGAAHIRVIVGTDGKPTSCTAYKGSADPAFDEHACKTAMRYARFQPALDAAGAPVTSYFTTTVVYQTSR